MKPSINFRTLSARNVVLPAIAMMRLGFSTSMLQAEVITYDVAFSADSFQVGSGPDPAPVDPVIGSFTITLDPDVKVTNITAGISLSSLNIDLGSPLSFSYDPAVDGTFPAGTLRVGGLLNGSDIIQFSPSTNDFWLYITDFASNPAFSQVGYTQTSVRNNNLFFTLNQTGSVGVFADQPVTVAGETLSVAPGIINSGGLEDLENSDNNSLVLFRDSASTAAITQFVLGATSPSASPSLIEFVLEGRCVSRPNVVQRVEFFSYATGAFEIVDELNAVRMPPDLSITVIPDGDLSRFVDQTTLEMQARVRYRVSAGKFLLEDRPSDLDDHSVTTSVHSLSNMRAKFLSSRKLAPCNALLYNHICEGRYIGSVGCGAFNVTRYATFGLATSQASS